MGKEAKTNAMRILEREKVPYTAHEYAHEEGVAVAGVDVAGSMGEDPACVYKTLVTQGSSKNYFVFVIPVAAELDLKAAARSVGEKSVAMIHVTRASAHRKKCMFPAGASAPRCAVLRRTSSVPPGPPRQRSSSEPGRKVRLLGQRRLEDFAENM